MATRICYSVTAIPDYKVFDVKVPAGETLQSGDLVILNEIEDTIGGNFQVMKAVQPTTALLASDVLAIVIDGGNFEEMADGRRPDGNPNYGEYTYGDTAPVVLLDAGMRFYITDDCLADATNAVKGDFIVGANGAYQPTSAATVDFAVNRQALKILEKKHYRAGGKFGAEFVSGSVCIVQQA